MSEEMDPLTRREKPQSLDVTQNTKSLSESCDSDSSLSSGSNKRLARNRSRSSETRSQREHSSDGVITTPATGLKTNVGLCNEFDINDDGQRKEGYNFDDHSPSSQSSLTKSLLGRSLRLPSIVSGATTRKCVLTLDGYSYVIVASTPENLPKKDDSASSGGNNLSTGCHIQQTGSSATNTQQHHPTSDKVAFTNTPAAATAGGVRGVTGTTVGAGTTLTSSASTVLTAGGGGSDSLSKNDYLNVTSPSGVDNTQESIGSNISVTDDSSVSTINGQIASHGALTIVRRSNSRKSINQQDNQNSFPGVTTSTPSSATNQTFLSDPQAKYSHHSRTDDFPHHQHNPPLTPTSSNAPHSSSANANAPHYTSGTTTTTTAAQNIIMLPTSPNATASAIAMVDGAGNAKEECIPCTASGSTISMTSIDLTTDDLPAVDTPDACDKAALRLRSILRMLNTGEVKADVLQKNLHYAARVLEAVFLDESKSPTSRKSKLRQGSCSSNEFEDHSNKRDNCNGDCKNADCNQHGHTAYPALDPSASDSNEKNNINTSCEEPSNQSGSIDSRTKGVCSAPQTHGGPTGPPYDKDNPPSESAMESAETNRQTITITCSSSSQAMSESVSISSVSSSSCGNKATIQRQKRLRTPVWARSMSSNKTTYFRK